MPRKVFIYGLQQLIFFCVFWFLVLHFLVWFLSFGVCFGWLVGFSVFKFVIMIKYVILMHHGRNSEKSALHCLYHYCDFFTPISRKQHFLLCFKMYLSNTMLLCTSNFCLYSVEINTFVKWVWPISKLALY